MQQISEYQSTILLTEIFCSRGRNIDLLNDRKEAKTPFIRIVKKNPIGFQNATSACTLTGFCLKLGKTFIDQGSLAEIRTSVLAAVANIFLLRGEKICYGFAFKGRDVFPEKSITKADHYQLNIHFSYQ